MMKIKNIKWTSTVAKEAELIVTDGENECLVFSQPCTLKIGEELYEPLQALDVENLMKVINENTQEQIHKRNESYFSHCCVAKVIDIRGGVVAIGGIKIELGCKIPGWASEGDLIEFICSRLDIW